MSHNHQLTWLDFHIINSLKSANGFAAITFHYKSSGNYWVINNVVDTYIHSTIKKANQINQEKEFGSLDCDHGSLVISQGKIQNVAVFAQGILVQSNLGFRTQFVLEGCSKTDLFKSRIIFSYYQ